MAISLPRLPLLATLLAAVACSDSSGPDGPAGPPRIVFASWRDGNAEIYSMAADGSDQRNLTQHPQNDYMPAWSPDHRRIAFVSGRAPAGLWIMNADGSDPRPVGDGFGGYGGVYPSWSPDGSRIAFSSNLSGIFAIHTVRPDGAGLTRVTDETDLGLVRSPTWSPDGTRIAYVAGGQVLVRNANGTGAPSVVTPFAFTDNPSWSPDGARIAFDRSQSGVLSIWTVAPDGSSLAQLTTPPPNVFDSQPAWSPDGTQLVFLRAEGTSESDDIWVVNADGSGARNLTAHPGSNQWPSW